VADAVATNIVVFGRGLVADGPRFRLTQASSARVAALVGYVRRNAGAFGARRGRIVFSGGWAGAADGIGRPPPRFREGNLMLEQARAADIGGENLGRYADAYAEIESDSTLENALRTREAGYFAGLYFTARDPLGLVTHAGHLARVDYLMRRVYGLPRDAVVPIVAPGADDFSGGLPESLLLPVTRLAFLGARDTDDLRRRHRLLVAGRRPLRLT
jgi:hypothetical protein